MMKPWFELWRLWTVTASTYGMAFASSNIIRQLTLRSEDFAIRQSLDRSLHPFRQCIIYYDKGECLRHRPADTAPNRGLPFVILERSPKA